MPIKNYNGFLLLSTLSFFLLQACREESDKVKPQMTSLTESVYASLTVQPESLYSVYPAVGGILKANLVTEGDVVAKGQPLAQIENANPELNTRNALLAYELTKENYSGQKGVLQELENQIRAAQLKLTNDSVNYLRQKKLWEQNIGSKIDYDTRSLAYETSLSEVARLRSRYAQTKNQLKTQLEQAELNYQTSLNTKGDFLIKSLLDGKVYELKKNPGEIVSLQEPVALVGSKDSFLLEMQVDEVDIAKISEHQTVLVRLDAYDKEVFEATVRKIYPKMDVRSQTFLVEAVFKVQPAKLYPGLTGEANIITSVKEKALAIPYEYLLNGNKVKTEKGEVTVTIGIKNFEHVEIISGIDTTTYIYKPE